jgi:hypothetical protein
MPLKIGRIEVNAPFRHMKADQLAEKRNDMGGNSGKSAPAKQDNDKSKKPKGKPIKDEDYEDGDIATPKRDRYGNDDEPL